MCYYYNDTEITDLYTAALRCYEENARLASIADEEEQSFLTSMVCIQYLVLDIPQFEFPWTRAPYSLIGNCANLQYRGVIATKIILYIHLNYIHL